MIRPFGSAAAAPPSCSMCRTRGLCDDSQTHYAAGATAEQGAVAKYL